MECVNGKFSSYLKIKIIINMQELEDLDLTFLNLN